MLFFEHYEGLNELRQFYKDAGVDRTGSTVTSFTAFQSMKDVQHDLQDLLIKPLTCSFLSWYVRGAAIYKLQTALLHLCCFAPSKAWDHLVQASQNLINGLIFYPALGLLETVGQSCSFLLRCMITVGSAMLYLITPKKLAYENSLEMTPEANNATSMAMA